MRRPSPAHVPTHCRKLSFETLESRELLAADVGLDWWAEPSDFPVADDWSWTFDESWAGDTGAEPAWDDGWWVDDVSWNDVSWDSEDPSASDGSWFDWSVPVTVDDGWVVEGTAPDPSVTPAAPIDVVTTPLDGPEPTVVVAPPADGADVELPDQPVQIVDVSVPPPVVTFDDSETAEEQETPHLPTGSLDDSCDTIIFVDPTVVDPIGVETVDDTDSPTSDVTIADVPPETLFDDTVVEGDATDSWVIDATPIDDPSDEPLPGSGTVEIREDIPVAVTGIVVDPAAFRPVVVAGTTPTTREPTPLFRATTTTAAPAARFAGWGAFFFQSFGRAGGGFDAAAIGGPTDGQTGSGRPRIRLPFRPVV